MSGGSLWRYYLVLALDASAQARSHGACWHCSPILWPQSPGCSPGQPPHPQPRTPSGSQGPLLNVHWTHAVLLACSHTLAQGRGQRGWSARSCSPCSSVCLPQEAHPRSQARAGPWLSTELLAGGFGQHWGELHTGQPGVHPVG